MKGMNFSVPGIVRRVSGNGLRVSVIRRICVQARKIKKYLIFGFLEVV